MSFISSIRIRAVSFSVAMMLIVQLLNLCVDPVDATLREDLTVNEIESVVKLLVEHVFGRTNVIEETDDEDGQSGSTVGSFVLYASPYAIAFYDTASVSLTRPINFEYSMRFESISRNIRTPPPKA